MRSELMPANGKRLQFTATVDLMTRCRDDNGLPIRVICLRSVTFTDGETVDHAWLRLPPRMANLHFASGDIITFHARVGFYWKKSSTGDNLTILEPDLGLRDPKEIRKIAA